MNYETIDNSLCYFAACMFYNIIEATRTFQDVPKLEKKEINGYEYLKVDAIEMKKNKFVLQINGLFCDIKFLNKYSIIDTIIKHFNKRKTICGKSKYVLHLLKMLTIYKHNTENENFQGMKNIDVYSLYFWKGKHEFELQINEYFCSK